MSLPNYQDICSVLFDAIKEKQITNFSEYKLKILNLVQKRFNLSNEEIRSILNDGTDRNIIKFNSDWSKTWLKRLNLINEININGTKTYSLTEKGNNISINNNPIDFKMLISVFTKNNYKNKSHDEEIKKTINKDQNNTNNWPESQDIINTPFEKMDSLTNDYYDQTKMDLYNKLLELDPYQFEKMIKKLLINMGYKKVTITQRTRDGGIDGIINTDVLGFNDILYQVKRYKEDSPIGISHINEFIGAIDKKTNHGLFFTTSSFTPDAKKKAQDSSKSIKLLDKEDLLNLMFQFNIGVKDYKINKPIKEIDDQFFEEIDI